MAESAPFDFRRFHARFELAMIVASSENGVIGRDGDLPWHLPLDLRHFMRSTKGCPVIMGRKTFESLEKPLPDRLNLVVSRSLDAKGMPDVEVFQDLESAIERGRSAICEDGQDRPIWIAGGGTIYAQSLDGTDLIVRTLVHTEVEGDALFPEVNPDQWERVHVITHDADDRHSFAFDIEWWVRRPQVG